MAKYVKQIVVSAGIITSATDGHPTEADLSFSNVTTLNVSTSQHGLCPILPNVATEYLDGTGNWSTPAGGISTPVSVANGGTGDTTLTAHAVLLGEGTGNVAFAAPSTAGFILGDNGASADPSFQDPVALGLLKWVKVVVPYTSIQTAATTNTINLLTLPANGTLHAVAAYVTVAFTGVSPISCNGVGTAGNHTQFGSIGLTLASITTKATFSTTGQPDSESQSATWAVNASFTGGSNLSNLTAGSVTFDLLVSTLP